MSRSTTSAAVRHPGLWRGVLAASVLGATSALIGTQYFLSVDDGLSPPVAALFRGAIMIRFGQGSQSLANGDGLARTWDLAGEWRIVLSAREKGEPSFGLSAFVPWLAKDVGRVWVQLPLFPGCLGIGWLAWRRLRGSGPQRGRCLSCGYDRSGLDSTSKCPECGDVPK